MNLPSYQADPNSLYCTARIYPSSIRSWASSLRRTDWETDTPRKSCWTFLKRLNSSLYGAKPSESCWCVGADLRSIVNIGCMQVDTPVSLFSCGKTRATNASMAACHTFQIWINVIVKNIKRNRQILLKIRNTEKLTIRLFIIMDQPAGCSNVQIEIFKPL